MKSEKSRKFPKNVLTYVKVRKNIKTMFYLIKTRFDI